jgi:hypothetical protein
MNRRNKVVRSANTIQAGTLTVRGLHVRTS